MPTAWIVTVSVAFGPGTVTATGPRRVFSSRNVTPPVVVLAPICQRTVAVRVVTVPAGTGESGLAVNRGGASEP